MKTILLILIAAVLITPSCSKQKNNKNIDMNLIRGLKPVISGFNDLEQKLIKQVIKNMDHGDYFKDKITAVEIENKIQDETEYYKTNRVTFFINPHVIDHVGWSSGMEEFCFYAIKITWKNSKDLLQEDIVNDKALIMELDEGYFQNPTKLKPFTKSLVEQDRILKRINEVFIKGKVIPKKTQGIDTSLLEDLEHLSRKNLYELVKDYFVTIKAIKARDNSYIKDMYALIISKGKHPSPYINEKKRPLHPKKGIILIINVATSEILNLEYDYAIPPLLI